MIKVTFELEGKYKNIYKFEDDLPVDEKAEKVLEALEHLRLANKEVS